MFDQPNAATWKIDTLSPQLIADIRAEWLDLAASAWEKNVYFFPWFIAASLHLRAMQDASLLRIYSGRDLIGLWVFNRDFGYAKLPVSFYRTALHPHQFLGTPLVRRGAEDEFVKAFFQWLDNSPLRQSFILLPMLSVEGPVFAAFMAARRKDGRHWIELERAERAALNPTGGAKRSVTSHISKGRLRSLKRRRQKLTDLGEVSIERVGSRDELIAWLQDFMRIENQGWKKDEGTAILQNSDDIALYNALVPDAFENGNLNFFRLVVGGKPIAYALDLICDNFVYCLKCSHDRAYRKYAPGVLLEFESLIRYGNSGKEYYIDTCTAPDNTMLNELFPDRKSYVSLVFARKNPLHALQLKLIKLIKRRIG
ncbi:MAG: GNAT family N-acetyltransferase [Marinicaulis sp.]|nr:GNAT family N-acetyltransferase [Marinicaulis sp.]